MHIPTKKLLTHYLDYMIVHQLKSLQMVNSSHLPLSRFMMNLTKGKNM